MAPDYPPSNPSGPDRRSSVRTLVVTLAAVVAMGVTARLGVWQLDRAGQKEALQAALDSRSRLPELPMAALATTSQAAQAQHHRSVRLRGEWVGKATLFLDNRQMNGRPGFFVVTPLRLEGRGQEAVLVQRGWVPRDARDRTRLPPVASPAGPVEVAGRMAPPPGRLYAFAGAESGPIRQNLDLDALASETGLRLLPLSVVQVQATDAGDDGLLREWPRPAVDVHKHYGYAFQWFGLCALITGLYVWFQLIRPWREAVRRCHA
jgi:surfeit locus 1 family protein